MDPLSILGIAGTALSIAHKSYEAGEALGIFINDVKNVDQTVKAMQSEIKALGAACNMVGTRVRGIADSIDAENKDGAESPLWQQVKTQLDDCGETVSALNSALEGVSKEHKKNPFAQAWRQIQLNMRAKDIEEARNRIRSHTASLQLVLQAITLEVSYLAPQRADQQLMILLENIRDIKQELSKMQHTAQESDVSDTERRHDEKELELLKYTDKIISSGETLYEGSVAGGSVIGPSEDLDDKITSWVSRLQVLSTDEPVSRMNNDFDTPPGSAISGTDGFTDFASDSGVDVRSGGVASKVVEPPLDEEFEEEEEDDMQIEMIKEAYSLGVAEFDNKTYPKANELLQEVLTMVEESPVRSSRMIDVRELRWMLAICAYHVDDFQTAEVALKEIVQIPPQTPQDRIRLCEAGHILALASLKQDKLNEARQYCDSALQGRRRLLGKTDPACYESLALLARIFELQDNAARAAIYARMIPEDQRETICAQYRAIGGSSPAAVKSDTISPASAVDTGKELPPLPPGLPPTGPPSGTQAASPAPAVHLPPDQKWRFRPPIPTKRPVEYVAPKKDDSSDDEDPFAIQKTQEAQAKSMQAQVSSIVGHSDPSALSNMPEEFHVNRAATWQPNIPPIPKPPTLPRVQSATSSNMPMPAQSYGISVPSAPAQPRGMSIPSSPAPTFGVVGSTQSNPPSYTPQPQVASSQREVQLSEILAFQADVERAKKANNKKALPVLNSLRNYAAAVHDFDLNDHEARALHEDVLYQAKGSMDDSHPLVYKTYANLARIAEAQGDFNKSSDLYQKVLDGMKKNPVNDDGVFKSTVQSQLAESFMNISKPDKAYSVLVDELSTRRRVYGSRLRSVETADCVKRLDEVRKAMMKPPKHVRKRERRARKRGEAAAAADASIDDGASVDSADSDETAATGSSSGLTRSATASSGSGLTRSITNTSDSVHDLLKSVHPALASRVAKIASPPPSR